MRSVTIVTSQEVELFLFNVETMFRSVDLSFLISTADWVKRAKENKHEFVVTKMT